MFPDGPSAATQAHATPVVHPLLLAHSRHGGGGSGSGGGGSSRSSGRRSSRLGVGGGGGSASSRHHPALGLLTHERLIWDGHVGGGTAAPPPHAEHTMMDALEVGKHEKQIKGEGGGRRDCSDSCRSALALPDVVYG